MTKGGRRLLEGLVAGVALGAALVYFTQRFLEAQRIPTHHPDYELGTLIETGGKLDLAIGGRGYFQFQRKDGSAVYSRHSHFTLDANGSMVGPDDLVLAPGIVAPPDYTDLRIDPRGAVGVDVAHNSGPMMVGNIPLFVFSNPDGLLPAGKCYFRETEKSGAGAMLEPGDNGAGLILQGYQLLPEMDVSAPAHLRINAPFYDGMDDTLQEPVTYTGRELDFGIEGPGFAEVKLPNGMSGYTRWLHLFRDEGWLVNKGVSCVALCNPRHHHGPPHSTRCNEWRQYVYRCSNSVACHICCKRYRAGDGRLAISIYSVSPIPENCITITTASTSKRINPAPPS